MSLSEMQKISCTVIAVATSFAFSFYIALVIYDFYIFDHGNGNLCPPGLFPCGVNSSVCIEQKHWCDNIVQCPNGEDEEGMQCTEDDKDEYTTIFEEHCYPFVRVPNRTTNRCGNDKYTTNCTCNPATVKCVDLNLISIPSGFSISGQSLSFANNSIDTIRQSDFRNFSHLQLLNLENNSIRNLIPNTFKHLTDLRKLFLSTNKLSRIVSGTFRGLGNLTILLLDKNQLLELHEGAFDDLHSLCLLWLQDNRLTLGSPNVFASALTCMIVELNNNFIENITETTFSKLPKLRILRLSNNSVTNIEPSSFEETRQLVALDLSYNRIKRLPRHLQNSNGSLKFLSLASNPIETFHEDNFATFTNLITLNLSGIRSSRTYRNFFRHLPKLQVVHFSSFEMCRYTPMVRDCNPRGDGISSFENLLEITLLRFAIWIVAFATCVGNATVMVFRVLFHEEGTVHALFIQHLAAADFLMGIYLLIIATHDSFFRDQYNRFALKWMDSWTCQAAGIIALISSEVSVLILTCMSFECCMKITLPYLPFTLTRRSGFIILCLVWITGAITAVIPFSSKSIFGDSFYGSNGVCFPLHIHEPFQTGWQYSAFIFIGMNLMAMVTIMVCNFGICFSLYRTKSSVPVLGAQETITKRLFAITFANVLCWIPVITIKIIALADGHTPDQLYAWLTVFVLPINSALDPLIYTLTTPNFKRRCQEHFTSRRYFSCSQFLLHLVWFQSQSSNTTTNLLEDYIDFKDKYAGTATEQSQTLF